MNNHLICNLCNSNNIDLVGNFKNFSLYRCNNCKLTFSKLYQQDLNLYSKTYFEKLHPEFFSECVNKQSNKDKIKLYRLHLKFLSKYKKGGTLLDIGCGSGTFLNEAKKQGFSVYGVDISDYAVKSAKKIYKLNNVFCGDFNKLKHFKSETLDVITMNDVLEHVENPKVYIKSAYKLLKNGGILMIYTINESSLLYNLANFIYKTSFKLIKKPMELSYPIHHNYHFKESNLNSYFNGEGFDILFKRKSNMPISAAKGGFLIKIILNIIYLFSYIFKAEYEILYICQKNIKTNL